MSKLVAQYYSGLRVTSPVFLEIIPREDTESRDKEMIRGLVMERGLK